MRVTYFFSRLMAIYFEPLIKKKQAISYIEDTIMQSQNKAETFSIIHQYDDLLTKAGLKTATEKTFLFLKRVKFLGHVISSGGIQPIAQRVKDLKNLTSPECERDFMKVLGCHGLYSCYIKNVHVDSKTFYGLVRDSTLIHWTEESEKIVQLIKDRISQDMLAIPSTAFPFRINGDSFNVGAGCILIQQFPGKNGSYPSIPEFLIKQNRKYQHSTGICVGLCQLWKLMSYTLLDLPFQ